MGVSGTDLPAAARKLLLFVCCIAAVCGQCPKPPSLQMAQLKDPNNLLNSSFPNGTRLVYECRPGYIRIPGKTYFVTCLQNGNWTTIEEFCLPKSCGLVPDVSNGKVQYSNGLVFGSVATFTCDEGYIMIGKPERQCLADGWSYQNPTCDSVICNEPPTIANVSCTVNGEGKIIFGTVATCKCNNANEDLIGEKQIHCTSKGEWSGPTPYCKEVKCPNPEVQNGQKVSNFGPVYTYQDSVTFECKPGFVMMGKSTVTCNENNSWVPTLPKCQDRLQAATTAITTTSVTAKPGLQATTMAITKSSVTAKPESTTTTMTSRTSAINTDPREEFQTTTDDSKSSVILGSVPLVLVLLTLNVIMHN